MGYRNAVAMLDLGKGKVLTELRDETRNYYTTLLFDGTNRTILVGSATSQSILIFNTQSGHLIAALEIKGGNARIVGIDRIALSPNGRFVAASNTDNEILLWNLSERVLIARTRDAHKLGSECTMASVP